MPTRFSGQHGKTLVDAFFHAKDQKLLEEFRKRLERKDRRAQLADISGIRDEAVLDRLIELDITPETLAAITVVPLVQVAWADGRVQPEEREAIITAAKEAGIKPHQGHYPLLEHWLSEEPSREMLEAWEHYIQALCKTLSAAEVARLKGDVLSLARKVAQSAGGVLGLGNRISKAERRVLDGLEKAFGRVVADGMQRKRSADSFSVVAVSSCSKSRQENKKTGQ